MPQLQWVAAVSRGKSSGKERIVDTPDGMVLGAVKPSPNGGLRTNTAAQVKPWRTPVPRYKGTHWDRSCISRPSGSWELLSFKKLLGEETDPSLQLWKGNKTVSLGVRPHHFVVTFAPSPTTLSGNSSKAGIGPCSSMNLRPSWVSHTQNVYSKHLVDKNKPNCVSCFCN